MIRSLVSTIVFAGLGVASAANPDFQPFVGDYAGWAYLNDGSDLPLRLHVRVEGGTPTITLDAPHQKSYGMPTTDARIEGRTLKFQRRNSQGNLWTFEAKLTGGTLEGEAKLDGEPIEVFELHRSAKPLPEVRPETYADCRGIYRLGKDRTIVISSWFWGELKFTETQTGRYGTLFALSESEFFAGTAQYVPSAVFATLRFERDSRGQVERLIWQQGESAPMKAERLRLGEENVEFRNGDVQLRGTILKPEGPGPYSAIVMLGGSNWHTRKDVRNHADLFAAMGLATLIYDQRGQGESTGKAICSFEETAADACAAVAMLKGRSDIRPDRIGLWGASRGGWFAPLAASQCKDVAFMVLFVPPAISPARQETTRRLNVMRAEGLSEPEVQEGAAYLELLWKATRSDDDWNRYLPAREKMAARKWLDYLDEYESRESEDFEWDRLNMQYDPIPALEKVTCPLLALFGERDTNVVPAENMPTMETALKKAGNTHFTLKAVPNVDHGLQLVDPERGRYFHRSTGYAPELWNTIQTWLAKDAAVFNPKDSTNRPETR